VPFYSFFLKKFLANSTACWDLLFHSFFFSFSFFPPSLDEAVGESKFTLKEEGHSPS
jgi:hypothetical protein